MAEQRVEETLDVRDIDGEPFGDIMAALEELEVGNRLRLINSFEPEPLYNVLRQRGYTYEMTQVDTQEYHVDIEHAE